MLAYFQNGGHQPEVVIYHHLCHLAGPFKELFTASVHDKSVVCIPTVCKNWLRIKLVT